MNAPNSVLQRALSISVVIPTWCEAERVGRAVARALEFADEVIVADAASPDDTANNARRAGARVVLAPRERGPQLHAGALAAKGDVVLFLHADAELDDGAREAIRAALADPDAVGGSFMLRYEPATLAARLFTWAADLRCRRLGLFHAEAGLFVRRGVYQSLGGFAPVPLFEDYELVRRMSARGRTVYLRDVALRAPARRLTRAPALTLALWVVLQALYALGVSAHRLAGLDAPPRPSLVPQRRGA